ncbi:MULTISPECIES: ATP-binding cassette domain-containing protein [unclassified Paenibacillus]|uniref:ABC transporter ATP-binding protein n=1 Tax=unclassified Paenibacillus TaxID=185978 RepID=UPI0024056BFD|nr:MULTISPECIES: ATP-binding cassette domain-containing protein [unclassified Paenibacillus]MDF9844108.1 putative ABC transport system ATP-binding protein [Paenibacillus sp. PastF-2]MDF9850770.1 putative ABC transport system ATP-binding protein [Paenibacillus sp. PastM-2]MDF9857340.1 putative ABC transport system ATP-binding protein [Paenibacillus sp. PastF-1]MDH6482552.1 putative ABC transport system ATP-binding protein [Paenibacillus sp. PastH-2]MDH6509980.1 putative ABC transport system ATP
MLKIENLRKVFFSKSSNEKVALDNISFCLRKGEFVTVIGGNGSGKSTLFNCISGFETPDEGRIVLDSADITYHKEFKRAKYLGRVFQDPLKGTAYELTIEENLALAYSRGQVRGLTKAITNRDVLYFRERLSLLNLDLENRLRQKVGLLSGGQRQAITLLMATLVKPKLLLLDEHTAALDPSTARKVMEMTAEIVNKEQISTIMITHNLKDALEFGTRTIMLSSGNIILDVNGQERQNTTAEQLLLSFGYNPN